MFFSLIPHTFALALARMSVTNARRMHTACMPYTCASVYVRQNFLVEVSVFRLIRSMRICVMFEVYEQNVLGTQHKNILLRKLLTFTIQNGNSDNNNTQVRG